MQSGSPSRWRINPACRFRWRHWDEEYILFNVASSQTHFLNEFGVGALQLLQEESLDVAAFSKRLTLQYGLELDAEVQTYIDSMLADFDKLGLIEPYVE